MKIVCSITTLLAISTACFYHSLFLNSIITRFLSDILLQFPNLNDLNMVAALNSWGGGGGRGEGGRGGQDLEKCWPPWLTDGENFSLGMA